MKRTLGIPAGSHLEIADGQTLVATVAEAVDGAATTRRLVAAWNSCDGIDTPTLERTRVDETVGRLVMARNSLRAALEGLLARIHDPHREADGMRLLGIISDVPTCEAIDRARDAIAKTKES